MKIDNKTIIDAARRQREQDENTIDVPRWRTARRHSLAVPAWAVALPAAAVAGFLVGLFVRHPLTADQPLTALVDTVYITREVPADAVEAPNNPLAEDENSHAAKGAKAVKPTRKAAHASTSVAKGSSPTGCNISEDGIKYSMLMTK